MTICETAKGSELTSNERTLIDRCVKETYHDFITSHGNMSKIPTFTDFYKNLVAMSEIEAKSLALSLELYITGSFNIFQAKRMSTPTSVLWYLIFTYLTHLPQTK